MAATSTRSSGIDMWLAFLAGDRVWGEDSDTPRGIVRTTAIVELVALVAVLSTIWLLFAARTLRPGGFTLIAPILGSAAVLALATRPIRALLGDPREARLWISVLWRAAAGVLVVVAVLVNAPAWGNFAVAALGIVAGVEAVLCAWSAGFSVQPLRWWWGCLFSALNLGVLAALVWGAWQAGVATTAVEAAPLYIMLLLTLAVSCTTAGLLDRVRMEHQRAQQHATDEVVAREHRRTAHWIHDDVAAELQILNIKLQNEDVPQRDVVELLNALDHRLRLRQLDELLDAGTIRLAELLQPYVRDAQHHGLEITTVPTFDDASLIVDPDTGRQFARSASLLTTNAIQAGATALGYAVRHETVAITLTVTDDAGGFDLAAVPAGRGLWDLQQQLGPNTISTTRTPTGTIVTVRIPLDRSPSDVSTPAH